MTHIIPPDVLAATETICRHDELAARTRHTLLKIEQAGQRAGWGSQAASPTIFALDRHRTKKHVSYQRDRLFTDLLHMCGMEAGSLHGALTTLAGASEQTRNFMGSFGLVAPTDDVTRARAGEAFYGYALRIEGRMLAGEQCERDWEAIQRDGLDNHPGTVDGRFVCFAARDGLTWVVVRPRGHDVCAAVTRPEGDNMFAGSILNALARMTNAMSGNPVPVPPLGVPFRGSS